MNDAREAIRAGHSLRSCCSNPHTISLLFMKKDVGLAQTLASKSSSLPSGSGAEQDSSWDDTRAAALTRSKHSHFDAEPLLACVLRMLLVLDTTLPPEVSPA